jgi:hypothetical protein
LSGSGNGEARGEVRSLRSRETSGKCSCTV